MQVQLSPWVQMQLLGCQDLGLVVAKAVLPVGRKARRMARHQFSHDRRGERCLPLQCGPDKSVRRHTVLGLGLPFRCDRGAVYAL